MCRQLTDERGFDLDHHIPLEIGGDDTDDNLRPLCRPCHRLKTRGDASDIAKAKRREAAHVGALAKPSSIKSRGFAARQPQARATTPLTKKLPRRQV
jgi:hypothetical protein